MGGTEEEAPISSESQSSFSSSSVIALDGCCQVLREGLWARLVECGPGSASLSQPVCPSPPPQAPLPNNIPRP